LPWPVRTLLRGIGAMNPQRRRADQLPSVRAALHPALIELGHADTMARSDEVRQFLGAN
jgi:NTE family protein